jgi:hypothetical protein
MYRGSRLKALRLAKKKKLEREATKKLKLEIVSSLAFSRA